MGVPAHVTVLHPFVPSARLDDEIIRRLARVIAAVPSFDCTFSRCGWFGEEVLWLAPEPDQAFHDLTAAVVDEFPDCPPYGGAFAEVVPHLTIGTLANGTAADLRAAETDVIGGLPFGLSIEVALLMVGTDGASSWRTVATLPLAGVQPARRPPRPPPVAPSDVP